MSILTPGERPSVWSMIGDLVRRVARLEAVNPMETLPADVWRANQANDNAGFGQIGVDGPSPGPGPDFIVNDHGSGGIVLTSWDGSGSPIGTVTVLPTSVSANIDNGGEVNADLTHIVLLSAHVLPTESASIEVAHGTGVTIRLSAGLQFTVIGAGGTMLQMTDGSPDLHIQVGGTVVADL